MQTRTVFVLGAGSSAPYGLPTGGTLAREVADSIRSIGRERTKAAVTSNSHGNARTAHLAIHRPAIDLAERIERSRTATIDAYIAKQKPHEAHQAIEGMIDVLWKQEQTCAGRGSPEKGGDWIAWLFHNRLEDQMLKFANNKAIFVSFNYERVPRMTFATMIANLYNKPIDQCWDAVSHVWDIYECPSPRFFHPHGSIKSDPTASTSETVLNMGYGRSDLEAASANIKVMGNEDVFPRDYYNKLWLWAERVYFLGFGYHDELLRHLGLGPTTISRLVYSGTRVAGTGYGLTTLQQSSVMARVGTDFHLGPPEQDCLAFLQHELANDK